MSDNIMITGAAGFIGANFVHHWLGQCPNDQVVALDALTYAGNRANLQGLAGCGKVRFEQADVRDQEYLEWLLRALDIDTIVHFAAESHVDRSISGPAPFIQTNVVGTMSLLEAARKVWLQGCGRRHRFHHVSTDEVYGDLGDHNPPVRETSAYAPNSPYSASKAASDHLVRAYHRSYGLQVTTSHCSNNYGPYQFPEKLVALMITRALDGQPLPVYGDGRNVRDWLYVSDHCRGIAAILERGRPGESYNIGGNEEHDNLALVRRLCEVLDERFATNPVLAQIYPDAPPARGARCDELIEFVTDRPGHDRRYAINASKIKNELGFVPAESFCSGLARTVAWYLDNEAWWRTILRGEHRHWLQRQYGRTQRSA